MKMSRATMMLYLGALRSRMAFSSSMVRLNSRTLAEGNCTYSNGSSSYLHIFREMFGAEVEQCPKTVISKEYSSEWSEGSEPYYPVNDEKNNTLYLKYNEKNNTLYLKYKALADKETNVIFGGRLAEYKYYDMHHIVEKALNCFK